MLSANFYGRINVDDCCFEAIWESENINFLLQMVALGGVKPYFGCHSETIHIP